MFGTLFFWQNYFSQEISQVIFLQVSQKSSIFAAEFKKTPLCANRLYF